MLVEKTPVQFMDKTSLIHKLHPITKLSWLLLISTFLIVNRNSLAEIIILGFIIGLFFLGGYKVYKIKGVWVVFSTSLFISFLQMIFISEGKPIFSLNYLEITTIGLERAIYIGSRFSAIILSGFLFIMTTNPNILVYSFMQAGISYRLGFAFISALRLMSIFTKESEKIVYSSTLKGAPFTIFPINVFFKNLTNYFKLMIVSIFEKVDAMVISMEGRGFGNSSKRTFLQNQPIKKNDYVIIIIGVLALGSYSLITILN
jgi:energy-coupling factor transport system permease protein